MTTNEAYAALHNEGRGLFISPESKEEFRALLKDWRNARYACSRIIELKPEFKREYEAGLFQAQREIVEQATRLR